MGWLVGTFIAISLVFGLWCREFHGNPESARPIIAHAVEILGPRFRWSPGRVIGNGDDAFSWRWGVTKAVCARFPVFRRAPARPMLEIVDEDIGRAARRAASIRADRAWRLSR